MIRLIILLLFFPFSVNNSSGKGKPHNENNDGMIRPVFIKQKGNKKIYSLIPYVDTKVGVIDNKGNNCVIGPQLPFASINPSPQTPNGEHDGYEHGQPIRGFGQLHVSGTGWGKYGHFLLSPQIGLQFGDKEHDSPASNEVTQANYYKAKLERYNIIAEVTPSFHSAIYRFTFPKSEESNILFDFTQSIATDIVPYVDGKVKSNDVFIDSFSKDKTWGMIEYEGGFGQGTYKLYFYAMLDSKSLDCGVWKNKEIIRNKNEAAHTDKGDRIGSYFTFNTQQDQQIKIKVGISFDNVEKAKKYMEAEIPDWDFENVKEKGEDIWNEYLSGIIIPEASPKQLKMFYTAMYHSALMPRNRTGEFNKFGNDDLWDDHYAVWDTWRTVFPLYQLIEPEIVASNIRSFIHRYKVNGKVRDAFIAGIDMDPEQGGNDVVNIIADAILKNTPGFDYHSAYQIMKYQADYERKANPLNSAEGHPQNDPEAYKLLGWIPAGLMSNSAALEYNYNDYCTALVAKKLGYRNDYRKYLKRSSKWMNTWNPDLSSKGFKGFINPKTTDGKWVDIDATYNWGSWKLYFYEANSWTYSYFVPHDFDKLIQLNGGNNKYVEKLNYAFQHNLIDLTNEPSFLTIRSFNVTKRTDLNCYWVNYVLNNIYTEYELPGNDDSGAMSAWYVFSALGFFPNAGQNIYYLNAPIFKKAIIQRKEGDIIINAPNAGGENIYLKSVKINDKKISESIFNYDKIKNGANLVFELSNKPIQW